MASISSAAATAASTAASVAAWAIAFICIIPGPLVADVITDWDERAVALVTPRMPPPATERAMAMVNTAMFDAVNSIARGHRPFLGPLPAAARTPKEAAAAAAAGTILANLLPQAEAEVRGAMAEYLAT